MPLRCTRSSKVKERRDETPTATERRKAELQKRRQKELNTGPLPVLNTRAATMRDCSPTVSLQSSPGGITQTSPVTPRGAAASTPTQSAAPVEARVPSAAPLPAPVQAPVDATRWESALLKSTSSYMCCSMRVADQPENVGYYIYAVDVQDADQPHKVKLCSTSPPRRSKPLEARRPAPIFVPFEDL